MNTDEFIVQLDSGYYCAGLIFNYSYICIEAAPIIKWMRGKHLDLISNYCTNKGIKLEILL